MPQDDRRHDVDALRVFAFSLLILYHVGMFYVADWGWHVKSAYQAEWLKLPMTVVNQWRMPLLFLISGLALSFIWGRYTPLCLAARRSFRLLVPLVFGMAVVVAPQPYYEALAAGIIEPGFVDFMLRYLTFQDFPGEAWGGENRIVWTWNHLWYLPYVLLYTLAFMPLMVWGLFVFPSFPYIDHSLTDDVYAHVMYGTFFLYGFVIGRDPGIWAELARRRRWLLAGAVAAFAALYAGRIWLPDSPGTALETLNMFVIYLNRWLWLLTVLGWAHHLVRGPLPGLRYATAAVFCWYILHQTITVVAGYELGRLELGPLLEPLLVVGATVGGCLLLHEFVIRRVAWLRPLFGLPPNKGSGAARSRAARVPS